MSKQARAKAVKAWATLDGHGEIIDVHVGWTLSSMRHLWPGVPRERVTIVRPLPRKAASGARRRKA
jgi:hypothetical protein